MLRVGRIPYLNCEPFFSPLRGVDLVPLNPRARPGSEPPPALERGGFRAALGGPRQSVRRRAPHRRSGDPRAEAGPPLLSRDGPRKRVGAVDGASLPLCPPGGGG